MTVHPLDLFFADEAPPIWQLMRRDPLWRWLPWLALGSAVFCPLWQWQAPRGTGFDGQIADLIFLSVFSVLAYAAGYGVAAQQDDSGFQSALPVTARQIYLARTLSMIAALWIPAVSCAAVSFVAGLAPSAPFLTLVDFVSVFTLVMAGFQSAIVRGRSVSSLVIRGSFMFWMAGAGVFLSFALPDWASGESARVWFLLPAICWLCIAGIVLTTWRAVPESFQTAPLKASSPAARPAIRKPAVAANPWIAVWRSSVRGGAFWVLYCFFATAFTGSQQIALIMAVSLWMSFRQRGRWLSALPVPPAAFLTAMLVPYFLAIAGGYLVNVHIPRFTNTVERGITIRASQEGFLGHWPTETPTCRTLNILPAPEFWVPVKAGNAPLIQAPWGETFQPPLSRRFGHNIYNPYAVGCANSERFFDWQFSRATLAFYGRSIPLRKYPTGDTVDYPMVITGTRTQVVNVAEIGGVLILVTLIVMVGDWYRFRRLPQRVRVTVYVLAGTVAAGAFIWSESERFDVVQWLSWTLPASLPATIAVAVLVLAALYWVTYRLFRQLECTDKPGTPVP